MNSVNLFGVVYYVWELLLAPSKTLPTPIVLLLMYKLPIFIPSEIHEIIKALIMVQVRPSLCWDVNPIVLYKHLSRFHSLSVDFYCEVKVTLSGLHLTCITWKFDTNKGVFLLWISDRKMVKLRPNSVSLYLIFFKVLFSIWTLKFFCVRWIK